MNPFAAIFVPDDLREAVSDRAWLDGLLEAERSLVRAHARAGTVSAEAAQVVAAACDAARFDADRLAAEGRPDANPVVPLVRELREHVGPEYADAVHLGATSQDILDSAAMLVAREALRLVDLELGRVADACARHARDHRGSVAAARTLLQQAVPTTFGYKAAGWLVGTIETRGRLAEVRAGLPVQLGGAAGTLAAFGANGTELVALFAGELGLREPPLPWHTLRLPIVELGGTLAAAAGVQAKIATDVILLAQTEVGEVAEGAGGGSSTMPHKRNPAAAVLAVACERHARANASILLESAVAEHERAVGAWHAEWAALTAALAATGGSAAAVARSLESLEVDVDRMRANLDDATLSEARRLGVDVRGPEDYLGSVGVFIDRALALYEQ